MLYDRGQEYEETMGTADKKGKRKKNKLKRKYRCITYVDHGKRTRSLQTLHIIKTSFTDKTRKHCELLSHCECHAILSTAHMPNRKFYLTIDKSVFMLVG